MSQQVPFEAARAHVERQARNLVLDATYPLTGVCVLR